MARKVQNSRRSAKLVAALITLALITATAALAAGQRSNASDTLVFGASVIGVDVHKQSLTAVAVDEAGRMLANTTSPLTCDALRSAFLDY